MCLYSAASMFERSLSAAVQSRASKPRVAPFDSEDVFFRPRFDRIGSSIERSSTGRRVSGSDAGSSMIVRFQREE